MTVPVLPITVSIRSTEAPARAPANTYNADHM